MEAGESIRRAFFLVRASAFMALLFLSPLHAQETASPWGDPPVTVGHRGTTVLADENTMAAFESAFQHGLDMFECDPRLTADGVYVIMHDPGVDRTTNGSGKVEDMTLAEIKELRTLSGHEVPTLQDALEFGRRHDMSVYLDVKDPPPDKGELLARTIERADMTGRVVIGCYQLKTCRMMEEQNTALSTCVAWPCPAATLKQAKRMGADAVGTLKGLATKWAIKRAHKHGLLVITMPINKKQRIEKFKDRGLDAFQSDDPRLLLPFTKGPRGTDEKGGPR